MTLMNSARTTLLVFLLAAFHATAADIRQGLVAYWQMEGTDGLQTPDATPFSNNMRAVNMTAANFVPGQFTNAASFTGSTTYMTNLHSPDPSITGLPIYKAGSYTIMMWVKGVAQTAKYLYTEGCTNTGGATGGQNPLLILQTGNSAPNNAKLDVIIRSDAGGVGPVDHRVSTNIVFDNTWHHIAWVDDKGSVKLYVDGNLDAANFNYTPSGTFTLNTSAIGTLVRAAVSTGNNFVGLIDDVALWRRALTAAEVQQVRTNSIDLPIPTFPPVIVTDPRGSTNRVGDRVTFSATADGGVPFSYQWLKNGEVVSGATANSLTLSNLVSLDSADYSLRVTNSYGSITSNIATLLVIPDPAPDLRQGIVSWWSMDDETGDDLGGLILDAYGHNNFRTVGPGDFIDLASGVFGNAAQFDGVDQYCRRLGGFAIYNNPAYSIAFWINASAGQSDRRIFAESNANNTNSVLSFGSQTNGANGTLRILIRNDLGLTLLEKNSTRTTLDDSWHHVVWTETNNEVRLFIDGVLDETSFAYPHGGVSLNTTTIGALLNAAGASGFLNGLVDEVAVWSRAISFTEIQQLRTSTVPPPLGEAAPAITAQPASQSVFTRANVTFSFAASGAGPLFWNWRKNGTNLPNETNATLVLTNVILADAGDFDVVVTNSVNSATSLVAVLTVTTRPITTDLKIDFNNLGVDDIPANTEPGFSSFPLVTATQPFSVTRVFGGAEVTLSPVGGINLQSRKRTVPVNNGAFTQEKLFQDFVFAADAAPGQGLDLLVDFLEPNANYVGTIWSYDNSSSAGNRISDWFANGALVQTNYTFNGTNLPMNNVTNRFSFAVHADADGRILIQGRRSALATVGLNVFINALEIASQPEIRVQTISLTSTNTLRLMISGISASATHRVEQKTNVTDVSWTDVSGAIFGPPSNGMIEAIIPVPDTATRFYHVVEEP